MSKHSNRITQASFDQTKELLFRGESVQEIHAITGYAHVTIMLIRKATSLEDYQELAHAYFTQRAELRPSLAVSKLPPKPQEVKPQPATKVLDPYQKAGEQFAALLRTVIIILRS